MLRTLRGAALAAAMLGLLAAPVPGSAGPKGPFETSSNLHLLGVSPRPVPADGPLVVNTDLAFWGNSAYQGTFEGFRIVDISAPGKPKEIIDFDQCVQGTTTGNQGDVVVWEDILVRSWNSPAPPGGAFCGNLFTPAGQEGLHIFDVSDPTNPVGLAFVPVTGGSHTATGVPDPENDRLLVYNSASSDARPGLDIVEIPLSNPAAASVLRFEPAGRACHDTGVILGDAMLAACAGHQGFTVWSLDEAEGGSLEDPAFLYQRTVEGVEIGHSAAFSWDGSVLVFGHEPGGGVEARCQASSAEVDKTLFFFDSATGVELGRWVLPRPQTAEENCTIHNFNVVPSDKGNILVSGNYQAGIWVVDFTDPTDPQTVAFADPAPLVPTQLGGDWSSYWYDGNIYQSDIRRGLAVWNLSDSAVAGAKKLGHLNPQTQESTIALKKPVPREELTGSFRLVGHDPLFNRGMNAAIAIHGDYAYIGSRTDFHPDEPDISGIAVVDISDPSDPEVVNMIGPPRSATPGESSRELRVWKSQDILVVLHTNCGGAGAHECHGPSVSNFKFFDISGANAADPPLITQVNQNTHEFFLWEDPNDPERAFLFGGSAGGGSTAFSVWDLAPLLADPPQPPPRIVQTSHGYTSLPGKPAGGLHSLSISNDGRFAYFALLTGGFAVVDVSDITDGDPGLQRTPVTLNANRPTWPGPGAHSAIKMWGRDWAYVSDEVYGTATAPGHGCPWGWARMVDISDPTAPTVESQYREPQNYTFNCPEWEPRPRTSYSAHNPTTTPNVVFTSWHSNGLQAISVEDPTYPYQLAEFMPEPLDMVHAEDPRLSADPDTGNGEKVVMWSYPIIKDGLIYVIDLRNGLYVFDYDGRFEDEVEDITFLEGNSNLEDALCFEPVPNPGGGVTKPDHC